MRVSAKADYAVRAALELASVSDARPLKREQISAAHDVGYALPAVVEDNRQLIGVKAVPATNDEITRVAPQVLTKLALHPVFEAVFQLRYPNPYGRVLG